VDMKDKEPTTEEIRKVMAALGRRTSPKKAAASRENGKKPKKAKEKKGV
jgi:hypothetical protein